MRFIVTGSSKDFREEIKRLSREKVEDCYNCGKCTAGCPMAPDMDVPPATMIRLVQMGDREAALNARSYWVCSSCETCATRCPKDVSVARLMDTLRQYSIARGLRPTFPHAYQFNKAFMESVRDNGVVHELGMVGKYKLATLKFFEDMAIGLDMFMKGKLRFSPEKIKGADAIKRIYERSKLKFR